MADKILRHLTDICHANFPACLHQLDKFLDSLLTTLLKEGEQCNTASTILYSQKIAREFGNQPELMSRLILDQNTLNVQVSSTLKEILTQQGNKAKLEQMQHAAHLKGSTDINTALTSIKHCALIIWKDIYPVMRQVLNGYEQRYEALITFAHRRGQTAAQHIPPPFSPVMFPFVVPHLMKIADLPPPQLSQEFTNMKAQMKSQERLILRYVRSQLFVIDKLLSNWPPPMSGLKLITQGGGEDLKPQNRRSVRFSIASEGDSPKSPSAKLEPIQEFDELPIENVSDDDKPLLAREIPLTKPKSILKAPNTSKANPVPQNIVYLDSAAIETQIIHKKLEILSFYRDSEAVFAPNFKYFVKIDEFFRVVNSICFTYTNQMYKNIVSYEHLPAFKLNAHP